MFMVYHFLNIYHPRHTPMICDKAGLKLINETTLHKAHAIGIRRKQPQCQWSLLSSNLSRSLNVFEDILSTKSEIMTWGFVTCGPNEALVISGRNYCAYVPFADRNIV